MNKKEIVENQNPLVISGLKKFVVLPEQISNRFANEIQILADVC